MGLCYGMISHFRINHLVAQGDYVEDFAECDLVDEKHILYISIYFMYVVNEIYLDIANEINLYYMIDTCIWLNYFMLLNVLECMNFIIR